MIPAPLHLHWLSVIDCSGLSVKLLCQMPLEVSQRTGSMHAHDFRSFFSLVLLLVKPPMMIFRLHHRGRPAYLIATRGKQKREEDNEKWDSSH
jgi:hypothetical protein